MTFEPPYPTWILRIHAPSSPFRYPIPKWLDPKTWLRPWYSRFSRDIWPEPARSKSPRPTPSTELSVKSVFWAWVLPGGHASNCYRWCHPTHEASCRQLSTQRALAACSCSPLLSQFAAANSEELGVKCVPSLNLVYTEEEGYVTADVAEDKQLVSGFGCAWVDRC